MEEKCVQVSTLRKLISSYFSIAFIVTSIISFVQMCHEDYNVIELLVIKF